MPVMGVAVHAAGYSFLRVYNGQGHTKQSGQEADPLKTQTQFPFATIHQIDSFFGLTALPLDVSSHRVNGLLRLSAATVEFGVGP